MYPHTAPDRASIEANKLKEPEGERIRAALERFLRRHKIVAMLIDTEHHSIEINIDKLPPRSKSVLSIWGAIQVEVVRRPKMRSVVSYFNIDNEPWVTMTCGHQKPLPAGVYDENTKRLCRECAK
jgi:hypothetical protein